MHGVALILGGAQGSLHLQLIAGDGGCISAKRGGCGDRGQQRRGANQRRKTRQSFHKFLQPVLSSEISFLDTSGEELPFIGWDFRSIVPQFDATVPDLDENDGPGLPWWNGKCLESVDGGGPTFGSMSRVGVRTEGFCRDRAYSGVIEKGISWPPVPVFFASNMGGLRFLEPEFRRSGRFRFSSASSATIA